MHQIFKTFRVNVSEAFYISWFISFQFEFTFQSNVIHII